MPTVKYKSGSNWVNVSTSGSIATTTTYGYVKIAELEDILEKNQDSAITGGPLCEYLNMQKTNCITEIPQDIKLELNNGVITLKAGSKVYIPNGVGIFEEKITTSDFSFVGDTNRNCLLCNSADPNWPLFDLPPEYYYSGTTAPTVFAYGIYACWYDTTNNVIKTTADAGVTWIPGASFPLCKATETANGFTSIDQVFNGFGYIGSTIFALPGVKGLISNGRNDDGTLKNIEFTIDTVKLETKLSQETFNADIALTTGGIFNSFSKDNTTEDVDNNYYYFGNDQYQGIYLGTCTYTFGVVYNFVTKNAFCEADNNSVVRLSGNQNIKGIKTFDNIVRLFGIQTTSTDAYQHVNFLDMNGGPNNNGKGAYIAIEDGSNGQWNKITTERGDNTFYGANTFNQTIQGTAYRALWGDLAEYYLTDAEYPKGTLVQFGGEKEITVAKNKVNAVITSEPGFILNGEQKDSQAIALIGRVPVRIIGKVKKFDKIALSYIDGVGCVNNETESPIGIALENKDDSDEGLIICSVKINF